MNKSHLLKSQRHRSDKCGRLTDFFRDLSQDHFSAVQSKWIIETKSGQVGLISRVKNQMVRRICYI